MEENAEAPSPQQLGGQARAEVLPPEKRREIAQAAALARWHGDLPKATHEGSLKIADVEIPCAVLADGTRVLSRIGFLRAIGRTGKAKGGRKYDTEFQAPVFLTADNLKPFIPLNLEENSTPIPYRPLQGGPAMGYRLDLLPIVCNVFLDAKEAGVLKRNQLHIAEQCKILNRGFSLVGLTALVDEATGYQEVRDRIALQEILDKYLKKEFAAWAKRFPDEFYQEIFRLRNWSWTKVGVQRPGVVAHWTNDLVYSRLAPGILRELRKRNPSTGGRRRLRHHQWLTEDIGHPALVQHLHALIVLMRTADTWDEFKDRVDRALPRREDHTSLPLFSDLYDPTEPEPLSEKSLSAARQ